MNTFRLIGLFALVFGISLPTAVRSQGNHFCGTSEAMERLRLEHPEVLQEEKQLEEYTKNFVANYQSSHDISRSGPLIIPVVFHIIHEGGSENISDAQVYDQMRILNNDFNKRNADTASVITEFKNIIANIGVEFRLASIDPWGNNTNGIDRVISYQTYMGNDYSKLNGWPRDKYMNVWVVSKMRGDAAGYAYYPSGVPAVYNTPNMDGVILLHQYVGSIGTSSAYNSRALTHEFGHCLNLKHVWGDSNEPGVSCGDDAVQDTPETKGWLLYCPTTAAADVCHAGIVENFQNFMEYSYCSRMFTEGQKARMLATLNSSVASRNNLYSDSNLIATGTADTVARPCVPKADFTVSKKYICSGGATVKFLDASFNAAVDEYHWEFPTGNPSSDTVKNPQIQFDNPGWHPATLTVKNANGSSTKTIAHAVFVSYEQALQAAPFSETFEDPNIISQNQWAAINYDDNGTAFKQVAAASHSGSGSAQLNNFYSHADRDLDELVSPGYDLSGLTTGQMSLSFYYSLASFNSNFNGLPDSIAVLATTTCGTSWIPIYKSSGVAAVNAGYIENFFVPTSSPVFWKKVNIALVNNYKKPNVHFKFQVFSAAKGNNFYIDDINIGVPLTGIEDLSSISEVTLYPNPTEGSATLSLQLATPGKLSVKVYDITGKEAMRVFEGYMNEGDNQLAINSNSQLSSGVYIVSIQAGESMTQRKLVVK